MAGTDLEMGSTTSTEGPLGVPGPVRGEIVVSLSAAFGRHRRSSLGIVRDDSACKTDEPIVRLRARDQRMQDPRPHPSQPDSEGQIFITRTVHDTGSLKA